MLVKGSMALLSRYRAETPEGWLLNNIWNNYTIFKAINKKDFGGGELLDLF